MPQSYKKIHEILSMAGFDSIFSREIIEIGIIGRIDNSDDSDSRYKIHHVRVTTPCINNSELADFISQVNEEIQSKENTGFKSADNGWSIFFLLKEIISFCRGDSGHTMNRQFTYFRGQSQNWEVIPSIFRKSSNSAGDEYIDRFEDLYQEISKRYPDKIGYHTLSIANTSEINERSKDLALLQHYGLRTSLLDITSNPYIALLFMIRHHMQEPILEMYSLDKNHPLFYEPQASEINNRIREQKGAFLNYDALFHLSSTSLTTQHTHLFLPKHFKKVIFKRQLSKYTIPCISIHIKYLSEETKRMIREEEQHIRNAKINKLNPAYESLLDDSRELLSRFDSSTHATDIYNAIRDHLRQKLREFGYEEEELFPDFSDYLRYQQSRFT